MADSASGPAWKHVAAVVWFLLYAVASTWPLALNLDTHIPGSGAGDNVAFLWNFWWVRHAAFSADVELFHTTHLFAPYGAPLALHTYTALPAFIGATLLRPLTITAAHNAVLLAGLAANGALAYALAWHHIRSFGAATLAGTVFAGSAYVSIHLLGHFNLVHAWGLPLAALATIRLFERPSVAGAALFGAAFAAVAYTDYYYFVYATIFGAIWFVISTFSVKLAWRTSRPIKVERFLVVVIAVLIALIAVILVTGGFQVSLGAIRVSASRIRNPLAAVWLLGIVWLLLRTRLAIDAATVPAPRRRIAGLAVGTGVAVVLMLPLIAAVVRLTVAGDYVSPPHTWRSGPRGIDLLTMVLGNPLHGDFARRIYVRFGIDMMEQAAWLGIVPIVLLLFAAARRIELGSEMRKWICIGAFFLLWSCGAYLIVAGFDTGLPMPQALARFVPVVSNARMPGRAFVMVQLAAAVLCATAVARLRWKNAAVAGLTAVAVLDGAVAIPLFMLPPADAIDRRVRDGPAHSVVELPVGVRDGFGEAGRFDHRALVHQIGHGRPIAGGFLARVPSRIRLAYNNDPALSSLLRLSVEGNDAPADIASRLLELGVTHVVVNTDRMPAGVTDVLVARGMRLVMVEGTRELYLVGGAP